MHSAKGHTAVEQRWQLQLAVAAVCRSLAPRPADSLATVFAAQPASPHASDAAVTTSAIDAVGAVAHRAADASDAPLAGRTAYRAVSYYSYRYLEHMGLPVVLRRRRADGRCVPAKSCAPPRGPFLTRCST